jgi:2-dehydro-3-deoxyphosphooctonate aldolase (KDO 8-P synthase)
MFYFVSGPIDKYIFNIVNSKGILPMKKNPASFFEYNSLKSKGIFFIAGPCVIESEKLCLCIAERLADIAKKNKVDIVFKASYDKANRTSRVSFRGPGMQKGLRILEKVKKSTGLAICTDIHSPQDAMAASGVADVLQIPAFLCRQTDLLVAAGKTKKIVNIKKGQFLAPSDMGYAVEKAGKNSWITERGTFFGYNRLVVDFAGISGLLKIGVPVIFDATHSVQRPGAGAGCSLGNRELAVPLARAALCMGVNGLFFEVHPDPDKALCDGPNCIGLDEFELNVPMFLEMRAMINRWHKSEKNK